MQPALPSYHIRPRHGWLNDPNGLLIKDGTYHAFLHVAADVDEPAVEREQLVIDPVRSLSYHHRHHPSAVSLDISN